MQHALNTLLLTLGLFAAGNLCAQPADEEVYSVVAEMPVFPGCEDLAADYKEMKRCADDQMLDFIYGSIVYPPEAKEAGVEGMAIISFTIEADGRLTEPFIYRNPGAGTGEEALRVVKLMEDGALLWRPGYHEGKAVRVRFNLPVKFQL